MVHIINMDFREIDFIEQLEKIDYYLPNMIKNNNGGGNLTSGWSKTN